MGVPVSPRNIFPSNIQGLPTWYEVRVSEAGHLGRRGGVDIMVAMNPATFREDVDSLLPGGYLVHDSTKPLDRRRYRSDINWLGIPPHRHLHRPVLGPAPAAALQEHRLRRRLSALLDMEFETVNGARRRPVPRQGPPHRPQRAGPGARERLGPREPRRPHRDPGAPERGGRGPDPRQRQLGGRPRLRLRGGDGGRLVPDHPLDLAGRRLREPLRAASGGPRVGGAELRGGAGRGRARRDRGWRSAHAGTARAASPRRAARGSRS